MSLANKKGVESLDENLRTHDEVTHQLMIITSRKRSATETPRYDYCLHKIMLQGERVMMEAVRLDRSLPSLAFGVMAK